MRCSERPLPENIRRRDLMTIPAAPAPTLFFSFFALTHQNEYRKPITMFCGKNSVDIRQKNKIISNYKSVLSDINRDCLVIVSPEWSKIKS